MGDRVVREQTVGASLDAGGIEVASELWTERIFQTGTAAPDGLFTKISVDSNGASPLSWKAVSDCAVCVSPVSGRVCQFLLKRMANSGGITDRNCLVRPESMCRHRLAADFFVFAAA